MRRQRGFTLIEVLVGLLILSFILITSLAVFFERQRRLRQADEVIVAYQVLSNEAELVRLEPFGSLVPGRQYAFSSDSEILSSLDHATTEIFVNEEKPGVRLVELTVRWNKGKKHAGLTVVRTDTGGGGSFW